MFFIPKEFAHKMIRLGGAEGRAWIDRLPSILAACEQQSKTSEKEVRAKA